jgi:hypothetical protein
MVLTRSHEFQVECGRKYSSWKWNTEELGRLLPRWGDRPVYQWISFSFGNYALLCVFPPTYQPDILGGICVHGCRCG